MNKILAAAATAAVDFTFSTFERVMTMTLMKAALISAVLAAGALSAPPAPAQPAPGDRGQACSATKQDSNGRTMTCTHTADSLHLMYWEFGGPQNSGYKTDPSNPYGHNGPCDSRDVHVSKVDPQTGNAIEVWGPPGCDPSLPMTGDNW
jgi:hypothetical protein